MINNDIRSIRILPSDKTTFKSENDFKFFIETIMINRGGLYYFPNLMMKCPHNTLVLFQYDGMIRAVGLLIESTKKECFDEEGIKYAGYYKFDIESLRYLHNPIDVVSFKTAYPEFRSFNQSKK